MNILHAIPSISAVHGGPSRAIAAMEGALALAGASVTTLTTDDDGAGRRLCPGSEPMRPNGATRVYKGKWTELYKIAPGVVPWLWRNVRAFDVVHIHALFSFTSIAAASIAALRGVPYVVRPLGTLATYGLTQRRPWLKRLSLTLVEGPILRRAAFVHCTSASELHEVRSLGIPLRGGVIPLGVEEVSAPVQAVSASRTLKTGARDVVLFLSRIDRKKNIEGLLRALAILTRNRSDVVLQIAGSGPSDYVESLKALASELAISERVEWLGHVEGSVKAGAFQAADIFVLPSFSENFGIAAVEAMLAGLPCILGQGVAIAHEARQAGAAVVVAPEPDAIAAALISMLEVREERKCLAEQARAFARREYSTDAMAKRLLDLYTTVGSTCHNRAA